MKNYSFKFSDELAAKVDAEAERRNLTYSDVIRQAVEEYFLKHQDRLNAEAILYEIVKTRALFRCYIQDVEGKAFPEEILIEAGKDAEAYLQERRQEKL